MEQEKGTANGPHLPNNEKDPQEDAFTAVIKTLRKNRVMVEKRSDGIYIRMAGSAEKGEAFSLTWVKVFDGMGQSNTARHAQVELEMLSKSATDPNNRPIIEPFKESIIALCDRFGRSGLSGSAAPMVATSIAHAVKTLLFRDPICDITGMDEEWNDVTEMNDGKSMYQNKRCSSVFKDADGVCTYVDAIKWKCSPDGEDIIHGRAFLQDGSSLHSSQKIKSFPFRPKTFYIDAVETETEKDNFVRHVKNEKDLQKVWHYYDRK